MKSDTVTRIAKEQISYDDASNVTQRILASDDRSWWQVWP